MQSKAELLGKSMFFGFPAEDFERGGREQFVFLLREGLNPESKLVDIGCGVLRAGYWLIRFLDPGCYFGIEPHVGRLDIGRHELVERAVIEQKKPRFDTNAAFDTSVFGEKFDFFLAYSVWTHASRGQIGAMLDSFVRDAAPGAVFLTTYLPSDEAHPPYEEERWTGTSHESNVPGCIHHSIEWIEAECGRRRLTVSELGVDETYGQSWLRIAFAA